jgi:hypothetical protein
MGAGLPANLLSPPVKNCLVDACGYLRSRMQVETDVPAKHDGLKQVSLQTCAQPATAT